MQDILDLLPIKARSIYSISKGWSDDAKFKIIDEGDQTYLLRVNSAHEWDKKRKEYDKLQEIYSANIPMNKPLHLGLNPSKEKLFMLLSWVDGEDAIDKITTVSLQEQYKLGVQSGLYLRYFHQYNAPSNLLSWETRYSQKIIRKIKHFKQCDVQPESYNLFIDFILDHIDLIKHRPQSFHHGDYHLGNMVISSAGKLGIIDFNRWDYGDPWEEFNRIVWSAQQSPNFASGYIDGYFDNQIPSDFFPLMALYIASNQLSSIPWSIPFGQSEIDIMIAQGQEVLSWYDQMQSTRPNWYIGSVV